ncbi:MAG: PEGA domain-containing protein [Vicinamibacterales bacterium]
MSTAPASIDRPEAPLFTDGLGERVVAVDAASGDLLQVLRLRSELHSVPSFEFALRERASRLANFRHAYYARVRRIDRHPSGLAIVSDHVEGIRLSEMLRAAHARTLHLDLNAALCLLRQLAPSVALLHENARDVAHGLLAPERIVVTPRARLVLVEHVLGSAVEQLRYSRERLWHDFRIAVPASAGSPRFDHRADVTAMGMIALALVRGRPLEDEEYPQGVSDLLNTARARLSMGEEQPLPASLRGWIARALQLDGRGSFVSAVEAQSAFEEVLAEDTGFVATPVALETFLSRYISALLEPALEAEPIRPPTTAVETAVPAPVTIIAPAPKPAPVPVPHLPTATAAPARVDPAPTHVAFEPKPAVPPAPPTPPARDITELLKDLHIDAPGAHRSERAPKARTSFRNAFPLRQWRRLAMAVLLIAAIAEGGVTAARAYRTPAAPLAGSLSLQTNPAGVAVFVDGVARGKTPAHLSLTPGSHIVELRGRGVPRVLPVTVKAGADASEYLELPETPSAGSLLVQSNPAGAHVSIDGVDHGIAPVSVAGLAPGDHEVVLAADGGAPVHQHVVIEAGVTSSVLAPVATAAPGPISGWLTIKAPVSIEIHENGRLVGTTDADRIMMAAGRHDLELVNDTLGYHTKKTVQIPPGKVLSLPIELPLGVVNLNALPWADVWIDGTHVGQTPLGNLALTIGPHDILFRNPQFGEKHQAISVTLNAPVRLSVEMK